VERTIMNHVRRTFAAGAILGLVALLSACKVGAWQLNATSSPVKAAHAALLPDGKVLLIEGSANNSDQFAAGTFKTSVWDPAANTFTDVSTPYDMFCSGHAFLANGKLLVAGGVAAYLPNIAGSPHAYQFNYQTQQYEPLPDMASGHWYPTAVSTGDGTVLTVAGINENSQPASKYQVFNPTTSTWSAEQGSATYFPYYPALTLAADGRLFYSGVNTFGNIGPPGFWDAEANTFSSVPGLSLPDHRDMGASILLPPAQDQKVMVIGGGSQDLPTDTTAIVDLKQPSPSFVSGPSISAPKVFVSAVILPDRTVFQTNGAGRNWSYPPAPDYPYVRKAQIYHPDTNTWQDAADATVGRAYHSEAILLPDGRVATFGSNSSDQDAHSWEQRIEIYKPAYWSKTRPVISVDPTQAQVPLGGSFSFSSDKPLKWVELVRPSSATHSNDPEQRLVDVPFTQDLNTNSVTATVDPNKYLVPPGYYMLFGVDANNVPSVARWVLVTYNASSALKSPTSPTFTLTG
jgi:hypothetical protein